MKGSNKFKVFIALFVVIVLVMGSSYAVWRYYYNGTGVSSISSTDLSFRFLESNKDVISIDSGIPMTDKDGINQNDSGNVFDFEVKSKALASTDVKYVVSLEKLDIDSGKTALGDSDVKIYVEDFNGNTVLKPTKISDLDNYKLFEKLNRHSKSNSEISTKYKLKVWIDDSVDVFSFENKQYKFKINVKTDQQEQNKDQTYKLVYNLDGGSSTSAISDSSFKVGDKVTITSVVPVKEGYEFLGWSTKKNDSTSKYNAGDSVTFNDAYDGTVTLYAVWGLKSYNVNVVIKNGSVDGDSTKSVVYKNDVIFNLVPDADWALGSVTCTNNQSASIDNKVLTVKGVTKETTCTVNYRASVTTLFNDGTLIINESAKDRVSNISKHGKVVKDYNAIGDSASYVMTGKSSQPWKDERDNIKSVEIGQKITPTSTAYWFMGLKNMEKGDFTNLDTSNVTDMSYMFEGAGSEVKTFVMDLSKFNTSKVTNMTHVVSSVGYNATTFSIGDLSNWDVSKVTNMSSAFFNLGNSATTWNIGDLSNWNTSSVTNMYYMFYGAGANATRFELDLSKWDVSKVTSVWYMFGSAGSNSNEFILDLSGWDLSNLDRMTDMFTYAGSKATTWTVKIPSKTGTYTNTKEKWYGSSESAYAVPASGKYFTLGNNVSVVVQNGSLASGESTSKVVGDGGSTTFNLIPSDSNYKDATVSCTNNQIGTFKDNLLTISNVTSDTTCTVNYYRYSTVLYSDGTLILNENSDDRNNNITTHGTVTKEYDPMNESNSYVMDYYTQPWADELSEITRVEIGSKMKPTSTAYWFAEMVNLTYGDFTNLDTSNVIDMEEMFANESGGEVVDSYKLVGLDSWDVSKVTNMDSMFYAAGSGATDVFDTGNLSNWDVSKVTDMGSMFSNTGLNATTWSIGDLSKWNTSSVINMWHMFSDTGSSTKTWSIGNLSNWDVSKVTDMGYMFDSAGQNATTWDIGDLSFWNTSNVTDMSYMFYNAGKNATTWSIGDISGWDTSNVTNMSHVFSFAGSNVTTFNLNLSSWNTSKVTNMSYMFYNAGKNATTWSIGDISGWDTSKVINMSYMFSSAGYNATTFNLNLSSWNTSNVTNMSYMFYDAGYNATTFNLNLSSWNTSKVTDMTGMFYNSGLNSKTWTVGDLSNWNVSNVIDMTGVFSASGLNSETWTVGDLSNWDVSNVISMSKMFYNAGEKATTWNIGDLSSWDVSNVTNMSYMFAESATRVTTWSIGDISNWDTSKVTDMSYMFAVVSYSSDRFNLNLSNWDVSNVTNMSYMFASTAGSSTRFALNLSNWDISKVTNIEKMFFEAGDRATWNVLIAKKTNSLVNTPLKWYGSSESVYAEPCTNKKFKIYYDVNVVVQDGTITGDASKKVLLGASKTFDVVPNDSSKTAIVSCTNNQTGSFANNVLTVSNVTNDTTCTVNFDTVSTVLYEDGTLILNEPSSYRDSNIVTHGSVTNEYEAMSDSNSYVFTAESVIPWGGESSSVTGVIVGSEMKPTSTAYWFYALQSVTSIDLTKLDTSNVTDMSYMFASVGDSAESVNMDLSMLDTSNVTNMESMFMGFAYQAVAFNIGDLSSWDVSKVTNMSFMFCSAGNNATTFNLDLSNWNTSKVTNMQSMFMEAGNNATTWSIGDILGWNTSKVTDMSSMFQYAGNSATTFTLDLSSWDISGVEYMVDMFYSAGNSATTWNVKIPKVTGSLSNFISKWYGSSEDIYVEPDDGREFTLPVDVDVVVQDGSLASGEVSSKSGWSRDSFSFNIVPNDTSKVGSVSCTNGQTGSFENNVLTVKNLSSSTTCTVTFDTVSTVLYNDGTLIINELASDRSSNITTHGSVTKEYEAMSNSNSYVFSSGTARPWNGEASSIKSVNIGNNIKPISTANWFYNLKNMESGDFVNLDTSSVTSMSYMFYSAGYSAATFNIGDLSSWDTSKVTSMYGMFSASGRNATTWSIGDLSSWNTSSVTNMSYMFNYAGYSATTFNIGNLSSWDTSKVTTMSSMFNYAGNSATTFNIGNLSSWNTSKVTNMSYMFRSAGRKATAWNIGDLSSWDTSKVTNMSSMFTGAGYSVTTFNIGNLSSWNTSSVTDMSYMFSGAGNSSTTFNIGNLSSWNTSKVTNMSSMFDSIGEKATIWSIGDLSSWDTSKVTNMSSMFSYAGKKATTWNIGDLSSWDTSKVTNMRQMFDYAGYSSTTFNIGNLSSWNTANATDMSSMFSYAGLKATAWNIGDLSSWDTSKVTNMSSMFNHAGHSSTTFNLDLSNWDASNVTNMSFMFNYAGYESTTFNIGNLSSWDTSKVTNMSQMFDYAGSSSTTFNLDLSKWDTSSVTDMSNMFSSTAKTWTVKIPKATGSLSNTTSKWYGSSDSVYASPPSGKSFTLTS